jgi:ABC-type dipeptide/oligopeptide/nickel transport system permease component
MVRYAARRTMAMAPVLFAVVTIIFFVVRVLPGDPAQAALGDHASQVAVEALRHTLGLDAPLGVQYVRFVTDLARGEMGVSLINGTPVRDQIAYNLPFTLQLTLAALVAGVLAGVPAGVVAAEHHNGRLDKVARLVSLAGLSVPAFYAGILLSLVFSVRLRWFPSVGAPSGAGPGEVLASLVLPSLTLGTVMMASVSRLTRAAVLTVREQEYVRTARAKGLRERAVVLVHTLRPALVPIVSLTGVWAVALIGDSVTTEVVFSRPGLGKMMVGAALQRDYTSLQSVMVVYTLMVMGINLLTDLAYGVVDPRMRCR